VYPISDRLIVLFLSLSLFPRIASGKACCNQQPEDLFGGKIFGDFKQREQA